MASSSAQDAARTPEPQMAPAVQQPASAYDAAASKELEPVPMDTFVARRPGAAELLRLPALPKPAIQQSLLRPLRSRAAFADTAGHF